MNAYARVFIYGDVIGVGYRAWTVRNASELGLKGYVRNYDFKTVEAVFEGKKADISEMVKRCKKGPEVSWVEKVETEWGKATGEFTEFKIRF